MRALGSTFGIEIMSTLSLLKPVLDAGHIDYAASIATSPSPPVHTR